MLLDTYRAQDGPPLHSLTRHNSAQCGYLRRGRTRQLRMASNVISRLTRRTGDLRYARGSILCIENGMIAVETVLAMSADGRIKKSPGTVPPCPRASVQVPGRSQFEAFVAPHTRPIADSNVR